MSNYVNRVADALEALAKALRSGGAATVPGVVADPGLTNPGDFVKPPIGTVPVTPPIGGPGDLVTPPVGEFPAVTLPGDAGDVVETVPGVLPPVDRPTPGTGQRPGELLPPVERPHPGAVVQPNPWPTPDATVGHKIVHIY